MNKQYSHKRIVLVLGFIIIAMFAFGYALVPLYTVFCKLTGLNGKTSNSIASLNTVNIDKTRTIIVEFDSTNNANLPWKFYPLVKKITLFPGENKRIAFFAENDSNQTMTVQAVPSVTPGEAAKYIKKTECFCFRQQTLKKGEALDMPVIFHVDSSLPKEIKIITLSYTLFDVNGFAPRPAAEMGKIP